MKKRLFFGLVFGLLAAFSILSVNTSNNAGDISLKNITIMAQANAENPLCPTGCYEGTGLCYCNGMGGTYWYF